MSLPERMTPSPFSTNGSDLAYDDLKIAAEVAVLRLEPGSGEADRVAHVRRLLDVSADLGYAASTYANRLLMLSRRRPSEGDLKDETIALQDALDGFSREVRMLAIAYRTLVKPIDGDGTPLPAPAHRS